MGDLPQKIPAKNGRKSVNSCGVLQCGICETAQKGEAETGRSSIIADVKRYSGGNSSAEQEEVACGGVLYWFACILVSTLFMSQQRQFQMVGGNNAGQFGDTTFTKIFVGGLAWETQRETMKRYFEQFGEIQEAVVITDKNTGRSKGYGFVTFKDPDAAMRACQDPSPIIDGRRANCNLASLGSQRNRSPTPQYAGNARFRPATGSAAPAAYHGSSSTNFHQHNAQYGYPYSAYGYSGYSQETMYPVNYYSVYGGQQFSPYYTTTASGAPGIFQNFYPFYAQYVQSSQPQGFGAHQYHHPQMLQYPYVPHHSSGTQGILSLPNTSLASATTTTGVTVTETTDVTGTESTSSQARAAGTSIEQNSSA
ncbi:hypothetical protein NE237_013031 [Protea cynaroides]|uniref:RRM domain-containing protein n=1 Tax=Protea cynaroides TaxID=273540 RepID=A0A9Q0GYK1_9MAGN|nr:hypothetical protein NE237_013031 [Protea cynaroides]